MTSLARYQELESQLVAWRRDFHQHPELGFQEVRTARIVAEVLRENGYAVQEGVAHTGVIGVLENGSGPVVMARFDMDALPVQEANDVPYASKTAGVMHACGHDAHVAIGLGVATWMAQHREVWRGTLKLIFQPGEEGLNGGEVMVNEGALENPRPSAALVCHVWSNFPVGTVGVAPGPVMAAAEQWHAVIRGRGGHAAAPHETVDPIVIAAHIITALQTIVSRNVNPQQTAVVSVGQIHGGTAFNIIPDEVTLGGTVRTFDATIREHVLERLRAILEGTAQVMGGTATLSLNAIAPAVVNDPEVTALVRNVAEALLGPAALREERTMGSEDAAFFLREIPGCYFFVGAAPADRPKAAHHNPHFDIDERALTIGLAMMAEALQRLMPVEG